MRQRLCSHLTFANVVSVAALFVALGGTATAVTYVVSSNSQIAPGTVSGHHPPSGDHPNIVPGSVNGEDVQDLTFQPLTFEHGWGDCGGSLPNPGIAKSAEGVVYFRGAICKRSGTSANAFKVPPGFAPGKVVDLSVGQFGAAAGVLSIDVDGQANVEDDPNSPGAGILTLLDGASYTLF